MADITPILEAIEQGAPHAAEQLLPLVYDELRKLAARSPVRALLRGSGRSVVMPPSTEIEL